MSKPTTYKRRLYRKRAAKSLCRNKTGKKCLRVNGCKKTRRTNKRKTYCRKSHRHMVRGGATVESMQNEDYNKGVLEYLTSLLQNKEAIKLNENSNLTYDKTPLFFSSLITNITEDTQKYISQKYNINTFTNFKSDFQLSVYSRPTGSGVNNQLYTIIIQTADKTKPTRSVFGYRILKKIKDNSLNVSWPSVNYIDLKYIKPSSMLSSFLTKPKPSTNTIQNFGDIPTETSDLRDVA